METPAGYTYINLNATEIYVGNLVWLSATSALVNFWSPVYFDQGIKVQNGLSLGCESSAIANTATIAQNEDITTQGTITCIGKLSAPTIYTKTHVDSKLAAKLSSTAIANLYTQSYIDTLAESYHA